jgi:hypothetical protein
LEAAEGIVLMLALILPIVIYDTLGQKTETWKSIILKRMSQLLIAQSNTALTTVSILTILLLSCGIISSQTTPTLA